MAITKGEWKREGLQITQYGSGIIALCPTPQEGGVFECSSNARFIAIAVNACQKVNPSNPQAVAESIEKVFEALKVVLPWAEAWIHYLRKNVGAGQGKDADEWFVKAVEALQSAEQKGAI